jgi:hypothetical protein
MHHNHVFHANYMTSIDETLYSNSNTFQRVYRIEHDESSLMGLGLQSQECFKGYWNVHKSFHKQVKKIRDDPTSMPSEFRGFTFTGNLRPCQKTPMRTVPAHIMRPDYADNEMVGHGLSVRNRAGTVFLQAC